MSYFAKNMIFAMLISTHINFCNLWWGRHGNKNIKICGALKGGMIFHLFLMVGSFYWPQSKCRLQTPPLYYRLVGYFTIVTILSEMQQYLLYQMIMEHNIYSWSTWNIYFICINTTNLHIWNLQTNGHLFQSDIAYCQWSICCCN